jgi:tungstate transport system substrate-binding protein
VDIALTYEREEEATAEDEGWSKTEGVLGHDHFVLAGPREDPAGIASCIDVVQSLGKIALEGWKGKDQVSFHTRGDGSATMHKEHSLWEAAAVSTGRGQSQMVSPNLHLPSRSPPPGE